MADSQADLWIAPEGFNIPDFIIFGAMKCGTKTVHTLLNKHPRVFIPPSEIHFFDMDNLLEHSDFFAIGNDRWHTPDITADPAAFWNWYGAFFQGAHEGAMLGEDSTCYLPSTHAARRIALQRKPVKLIVCLRQPTERTVSEYWHMLRTGRAMFSFDGTVRYIPHQIINRSLYPAQITNLLSHIDRERVYFFILERFIQDPASITAELLNFLDLPANELRAGEIRTHANVGRYPRSVQLMALKNRLLRVCGNQTYRTHLPFQFPKESYPSLMARALDRLHRTVNPLRLGEPPRLNEKTIHFLDDYFRREFVDINDLVGSNVTDLWFD